MTTARRQQAPGATEPDPRLFVTSVERALTVLNAFDADGKSLSITEIAARTKLGRSAAQRFTYTLHQLGYLRRDATSKHYSVSYKVLSLARSVIGTNTEADRIAPVLEKIARRTQETVAWVELDDLEVVILRSIPSTHHSSVNLPVGKRFAALSAASGQVLLASKSDSDILRIYRNSNEYSRTRFGVMSDESVLKHFNTVHRNGFSITEKTEDYDSISISVPVMNFQGNAVGAINISALKSRFSREKTETVLLEELMDSRVLASKHLFN
ncbi:IclR family transcriptional regulator [Bosea sp. (in: a-proteobacteria)]|uniref:IclR family transcriptional regulator n=1 Tax=Bosea sp. (in: a-proteobacteria) TaxID=1871050 RepID=UPI002636EF0D|nr:IclR family transcriptional regulator [Bosea sp. (in: a-proteobacteria)]MCO5093503.1 IclR family transcriptional regulator [Bosea sp. (in: a-proteobacteria)]